MSFRRRRHVVWALTESRGAVRAIILVVVGLLAGVAGGIWFDRTVLRTEVESGLHAATPPRDTLTAACDGVVFADSQGRYRLMIDPAWVPAHGVIAEGVELWFVGNESNGFHSSVNVLTQRTEGQGLDEYLDLSVANAPLIVEEFELVSRHKVEGSNYAELGIVEYGGQEGGRALRFLGVIAIRGDRAVVATLTAPKAEFAELRQQAEPCLLTLEAT